MAIQLKGRWKLSNAYGRKGHGMVTELIIYNKSFIFDTLPLPGLFVLSVFKVINYVK